MREIVQLQAPQTDQERSKTLHRMYQGFSLMLMGRGYPLTQIATASLCWGYGIALDSVGPEVTAETLRMLADSSRAEGVN